MRLMVFMRSVGSVINRYDKHGLSLQLVFRQHKKLHPVAIKQAPAEQS